MLLRGEILHRPSLWVALSAFLLGACVGSPTPPKGNGGSDGGATGGGGGGSAAGGSTGDAGADSGGGATGGSTGDAGADSGGGAADAGAGGTAGADGGAATGGTGGAATGCAKSLFGHYLVRSDGAMLYEEDPPATGQDVIRDAATGLPLADVRDVEEATGHGCAFLGATSSAWCWRTFTTGNQFGQLGNGTPDTSGPLYLATQVLRSAGQPLADVIGIAEDEAPGVRANVSVSSCALTTGGKVFCWGDISSLVNGGTTLASAYAVPITTDGLTPFSGVLQLSLHNSWACALVQGASAKEVWCWGSNGFANLGVGDQTARRYPTKVVGIANPTKLVANGTDGTTCVMDGMNVRCWGQNTEGEVGIGTPSSVVLSPNLVTLLGGTTALGGVVDLHAGNNSTGFAANFCALTSSSTIVCWGSGFLAYPTDYGATDVTLLGGTGNMIRYLTGDGLYHMGIPTNHVGTTRTPNCGPL